MVDGAGGRPPGIRIRTAYATEDEFITAFLDYCDERTVFTPTRRMLPVGSECAFSLELVSGEPMLRGFAVILDAWPTDDNKFACRGMHMQFTQLTSQSQAIHARLLAARGESEVEVPTVTDRPSRNRVAPMTQQQWGGATPPPPAAPGEERTETTSQRYPEEESEIREMRRAITRELLAHRVPDAADRSAVPVAQPDDQRHHTVRYEGPLRAPAMPARRPSTPRAAVAPPPAPPPARDSSSGVLPLPAIPRLPGVAGPAATELGAAPIATLPLPPMPASTSNSVLSRLPPVPPGATPEDERSPRQPTPASGTPSGVILPLPASSLPAPSGQLARGSSPGTSSERRARTTAPLTSPTPPATSTAEGAPGAAPVGPLQRTAPLVAQSAATAPAAFAEDTAERPTRHVPAPDEWPFDAPSPPSAAARGWARVRTRLVTSSQQVRTLAGRWRELPAHARAAIKAAPRWRSSPRTAGIFVLGIVCGYLVSVILRPSAPAPTQVAAAVAPMPAHALGHCDDAKPSAAAALDAPPVETSSHAATTKAAPAAKPATALGTKGQPAATHAPTKAPPGIASTGPAKPPPSIASTAPAKSPPSIASTGSAKPAPAKPLPGVAKAAPAATKPGTAVAKAAPAATKPARATAKPGPTRPAAPGTQTAIARKPPGPPSAVAKAPAKPTPTAAAAAGKPVAAKPTASKPAASKPAKKGGCSSLACI